MKPDLQYAHEAPPLFDNFVERRTRSQRIAAVVITVKRAVKWTINWKGARRPNR